MTCAKVHLIYFYPNRLKLNTNMLYRIIVKLYFMRFCRVYLIFKKIFNHFSAYFIQIGSLISTIFIINIKLKNCLNIEDYFKTTSIQCTDQYNLLAELKKVKLLCTTHSRDLAVDTYQGHPVCKCTRRDEVEHVPIEQAVR